MAKRQVFLDVMLPNMILQYWGKNNLIELENVFLLEDAELLILIKKTSDHKYVNAELITNYGKIHI